MRKFLTISIMLLSTYIAKASNHFVYLRFDESTNNVNTIKQHLSNISVATTDTFLLYYDHKLYDLTDFEQLLESRSFLSNLSIYEPIQENQELNDFLKENMGETVNENGIIVGENDGNWEMTFIMSEYSSKDDLIRWLDTNNFRNRQIKVEFIVYDDYTYFYHYDLTEFMNQAKLMLNF